MENLEPFNLNVISGEDLSLIEGGKKIRIEPIAFKDLVLINTPTIINSPKK